MVAAGVEEAASSSSQGAESNVSLRQRGVKFIEEPDVKMHPTTEVNAEGEGMRRLNGRRHDSGENFESEDDDDEVGSWFCAGC
jgi:hypothetical protein